MLLLGCEKFDFFLVGIHFEVETDYIPLAKLLRESDLANMPFRCKRFKLRLIRYWFEIFRTPGCLMYSADMLSRPAKDVTGVEFERCRKVEMHVCKITESQDMCDDKIFEEIIVRWLEDELHQIVLTEIQSG